MKKINEEILCAGHGGQGIMSMGKLLAYAGMRCGYNVTCIPSYGAEVRGGTAHSMVRVQEGKEISNPVVIYPTTCIVMNKPSLEKFTKRVKPGGFLLMDNSGGECIPRNKNIIVKAVPFTKMAVDLGDKRVANMVALGVLSGVKGLFSVKELLECLGLLFQKRPQVVEINKQAIQKGYDFSKEELL